MPPRKSKVKLPLEWIVPENMVARYATNMVVQRLENEYLISFFEVKPPMILGEPEFIESKVNDLQSIKANCVAQIIVAENKMPGFVNAFKTNLERSMEMKNHSGEKE